MSPIPALDLVALLPLLLLTAAAMAVLLYGVLRRDETGSVTRPLALLSLVATGASLLLLLDQDSRPLFPIGTGEAAHYGMLQMNRFAATCGLVVVLGSIVVVLQSRAYIIRNGIVATEYFSLLLFAVLGMVLLAASTDLVTIFLSIELLSISLYVMVGMERDNPRSLEAALKYFVLGSFASAFLIFGIAFLYGATATTHLGRMQEVIANGSHVPQFLVAGLALLIVGFGFKLALAPFHLWAPDVYHGAPTPITALIATASKVAGFAALLHIVTSLQPFFVVTPMAVHVLWGLAALSMLLGNLLGIVQREIKRLLAYSSIAHSGYIALAVLVAATSASDGAGLGRATAAMLFYLIGYVFMNLLAFGVATALGRKGDTLLEHYAGLAQREPVMAALMTIALFALTGIPLTAGFVGKVMLFASAVQAGYLILAIIGILSTVFSAYYYLRVVVLMYFQEPPVEVESVSVAAQDRWPLVACAAVVIILGVIPAPFVHLAGSCLAGRL